MERSDDDSVGGVQKALSSLKGFHALVNARRNAHYTDNVLLQEFCVYGRWWLDNCGNLGKFLGDDVSVIPKENFPDIADVLSSDEFWAYTRENSGRTINVWISSGSFAALPLPGIACGGCGQTWELANAHDCVPVQSSMTFALTDFVGHSLNVVVASLRDRSDALSLVQPHWPIRNDRHIDVRPQTDYPAVKINEHGWVSREDGITLNYVIEPGDDTQLDVWHYYHQECRRKQLAAQQEATFRGLFQAAGFRADEIQFRAVPNRYGSENYHGPWFEVMTPVGMILIGWRKRVINIDWSATGRELRDVFADVNATKGSYYVHAYAHGQVIDYLWRLRETLGRTVAGCSKTGV